MEQSGQNGMGREKMEGNERSRAGLAVRVLEACRNQLFFRKRFLEQALFRLKWAETEDIFLGNDGEYLYYSKNYILKRYMESPVEMSMDYLHTVMHCLYQHPFFCPPNCLKEQETCWNLAVDIAVECVLEEMREPEELEISDTASVQRSGILQKLKQEIGFMSAQKLYSYFQKNALLGQAEHICGVDFQELCRMFRRDDHRFWYMGSGEESIKTVEFSAAEAENTEDPTREAETGETSAAEAEDREGSFTEAETGETSAVEAEEREGPDREAETGETSSAWEEGREDSAGGAEMRKTSAAGAENREKPDRKAGRGISEADHKIENLRQRNENYQQQSQGNDWHQKKESQQQIWKSVADRVLVEAQAFAHSGRGEIAGNMLQHLKKLTRENCDYTRFLMKFATHWEERMQIDEDEFDYAFYTYGLKLFGTVPLIEPLEYREKNLIREFLIAIDTSGSCQGEVVERFLVKTYNILRQTQAFTSRVNIHIVQCDARIQEDAKIETQEELEAYIACLTLKGFGGTDFTPVFEYADRLLESGEIRRLDGLLYFTDGYGTFPARPPGYRTAFVFLDRDEEVRVPPWAMKVYLDTVT